MNHYVDLGDDVKKLVDAVTAASRTTAKYRRAKPMAKRNLFFLRAIFLLVLAATIPSVQAQTLTPLHNFTGAPDGAFPEGALLRDAAGNLYGTTNSGGSGDGTVFKIDSTGTESVLFSFSILGSGGTPAERRRRRNRSVRGCSQLAAAARSVRLRAGFARRRLCGKSQPHHSGQSW